MMIMYSEIVKEGESEEYMNRKQQEAEIAEVSILSIIIIVIIRHSDRVIEKMRTQSYLVSQRECHQSCSNYN